MIFNYCRTKFSRQKFRISLYVAIWVARQTQFKIRGHFNIFKNNFVFFRIEVTVVTYILSEESILNEK